MRKNAFTLIELLAVIVINIINDAKKSSQKESINMYGKAIEDGLATYFLRNPNQKEVPTIQELQARHYLNTKGNVSCKETEIYSDGKIYLNGCTVDGILVTYTYGEKEEKNYKKYIKLVKDADNDGEISPGDKYTYKVMDNMEEPYTFYVLKVEGDKVHLIQDRNICPNGNITKEGSDTCLIAWYSTNNDTNKLGPVTAMEGLYNATKNWTNVRDIDLSGDNKYDDEGHETNSSCGYGTIETTELGIKITKKNKITEVTREGNQVPVIPYEAGKPLKARLPREDEMTSIESGCLVYGSGSYNGLCSTWLTNGLEQYMEYYINNEHIDGIKGYWLLSSYPGTSINARAVYCTGHVNDRNTSDVSFFGIRAVITVLRSDLS